MLLVHASVTEPRDAFAMFSACYPTSASVIYMLWHDPRHQSTIAWPGASNSCALAGNEDLSLLERKSLLSETFPKVSPSSGVSI